MWTKFEDKASHRPAPFVAKFGGRSSQTSRGVLLRNDSPYTRCFLLYSEHIGLTTSDIAGITSACVAMLVMLVVIGILIYRDKKKASKPRINQDSLVEAVT
jgi:hypothetical protein